MIMEKEMRMIRVSSLTKDYGSRRAIDNLNFSIDKGEIVGFLGPNGAGKTTTMRILSGYIPPTFGKVEIGGWDIMENSINTRRIIGYMPETVPLYQDMTVFEYLKYMADLRGVNNAEDRVDEVLEVLHLDDRSEGYISKLSKGLKQRVGLAQSILHKPEVLILDEPTIGLDPVQIIEVRNIIKEIGKEHTVLLSTHILSEAQQVCNRVIIINKGVIVAEDSTEHLQARLSGSQRVHLQIRGDACDIIQLVESIPGVVQAKIKSDDAIEFETLHANDARPLVARAIIDAGHDLLDLHTISLSLEDIFMQLTHDEEGIPGEETPLPVYQS
jgi:ABC-2 type transport system ATP-binding protein